MPGTLYLVGTPIGNLGDFSPRAAETLRDVDFIAAEDTRVTMKLLNRLDIKKPLVSYHEHNKNESGPKLLERMMNGESCALVTDAGMPAISDPGEDLTRLCAEAGIEVMAVPGPSALVTALALSGLPTGRFTFEGFLDAAKSERFERLDSLRSERRTMVFYEAPHRLSGTLRDMLEVFGDRRLSISRELTKLHEETVRTTLSEAAALFSEKEPRGEYVLVVEGAQEEKAPTVTMEEALGMLAELRSAGMSLKDAAKRCSQRTGIAKNVLYDAALNMDGTK